LYQSIQLLYVMPIAIVKQSLRFLLATSILASANAAYAQSIVPARDGLNTSVNKIGNQYNISGGTQAGANLFYSLQKLGLSTGEIANFFSSPRVQNILTRVTGGEASLINGLIQVTGGNSNLYILNPAGIVFGATASLNVPANFSATTATAVQVGNGWFGLNSSVDEIRSLNGNINGFAFTSTLPSLGTSPSGVILNQGDLRTNVGQSVTLVGGIVVNTGTIATPSGNITIAATPDNKFIKITNEGNVLSLELPISARQALGNAPVLRGVDLPSLLTGKTVGTAFVAGNLDVAGANGGNVQVLGTNVNLSGANINASGFNGGGTVLIGGDYQGTGTTPKSLFTSIDANTKIHADALLNGNGGKVIVWSDGTTAFDGTITAKAGSLSGNGGLVETSGKSNLVVGNSAKVNTSALNGTKGTWLLDPTSITVVASDGTDASVGAANANAGDSTINSSTVVSALNGTNVNLVATNVITVNAAINASSNANAGNLTLTAPTTNLNAPITLKGASTLSGTATTVNVGASGTVQNGVDASAAGGTVNLAATTYTLAAKVAINKNLTVNGAGAANTKVSGNNAVQVVSIGGNSTVNINGLTVAKGRASDGSGVLVNPGSTLNLANSTFSSNAGSSSVSSGGAIYNSSGTINITNSTFSNNSASSSGTTSSGGAIYNSSGTINITNSTFLSNAARGSGGAIYNNSSGTINITNSTFSDNSARISGGAIYNSNGTINITNSTFSNNSTSISSSRGGAISNNNTSGKINITNSILVGNTARTSGSEEVSGNITSNGYNLVGVNGNAGGFQTIATDRVLAGAVSTAITALGDYGGATQTFALVPNSPAIDAGNNASAPATDQRGLARIVNGTIDIGSFESRGFTFTTTGTPQSTTVNRAFSTPLAVTVSSMDNTPVNGGTITFTAPSSDATRAAFFGLLTTTVAIINGVATAPTLTANTKAGNYTVTATATGAVTPANFTLTNNPDVAASITATSGTSQSTRVNTNFANQLQVLVRDQFGNLVPNSIVTFTSPSTGASTATTTTSATTDANGVAQVSVRANTISGSFVTTGTSGAATPANLTLTNTPDVPASNTSFTLTNNPDVPVSTTATSGTALSNVVNQAFKGANNSVGSQATKTLKDGAESVDSQATKTLKDEAEEEKNLQFE
jgi:filamentous hemagglutinin family protein